MEARFLRGLNRLAEVDRQYGLLYAERRTVIRDLKRGNGSVIELKNRETALSAHLSDVKVRLNKRIAKLNQKVAFFAATKHHLTLIHKHLAFRVSVHVRAEVLEQLEFYAGQLNILLLVID